MPLTNRNFIVLFGSQMFTFAIASTVIYSGGLIGNQLTENIQWATLPIACMVIGTAIWTYPATMLIKHWGGKHAFRFGNTIALLGVGSTIYALQAQQFTLFCLGTALLGSNLAFVQQYRFAVTESVKESQKSQAIAWLIFSGLIGTILSLQLIPWSQNVLETNFLGTYIFLGLLIFLSLLILSFYQNVPTTPPESQSLKEKPIALHHNKHFIFAVASGALGYMVMSFVMTATPLYMKTVLNQSAYISSLVIQIHIASMFLPSIFSAVLIKKFGLKNIIRTGIAFSLFAIITNIISQSNLFIFSALIFLGIGWNFTFVSATAYLTQNVQNNLKFKAQGINDMMIFSGQAIVSIYAGWWLFSFSWESLNLLFAPCLLILFALSFHKKLNRHDAR